MNKLTFNILPTEESNDHQVRILIDDVDWLGEELGIDPPEFFKQTNFLTDGELLIGRCSCGVVGCGDVIVNVTSDEETVNWITADEQKLAFDKEEYSRTIETARTDFSWEDLNRKVERHVSELFKNTSIFGMLTFDWASCRIEDKMINLSFSKHEPPEQFRQEIRKFRWNGTTVEDALEQANEFLKNERNAIQQVL